MSSSSSRAVEEAVNDTLEDERSNQRIGAREKGVHNVKKFKPTNNSALIASPSSPVAAVVAATSNKADVSSLAAAHTCSKCNNASFSSRNALFKHVKTCGVHLESSVARLDEFIVDRFRRSFGDASFDRMVVAVVGGRLRGRTLQSVEQYSLKDSRWTLLPSMLDNRGSHGAAAIKDVVYAIAGGGMESNLCTCEKLRIRPGLIQLDLSEGKGDDEQIAKASSNADEPQSWSYISPMMTKRHALCVVSGGLNVETPIIYAVGGWYDGSKCSGEMESYDSRTNTWEMKAPMRVPRRLLGACLHRGKIFAFGGMVEDSSGWNTAAAEVYDIESDTWSDIRDVPMTGQASAVSVSVSSMGLGLGSRSTSSSSAASGGGSKEEGGGGDDNNADKVVVLCHGGDVFEYNVRDNNYSKISTLPIPDWHCFECLSIGPFVFCLGGMSEGRYLDVARVFDARDLRWFELPNMLRQRRRSAAAAMLLES